MSFAEQLDKALSTVPLSRKQRLQLRSDILRNHGEAYREFVMKELDVPYEVHALMREKAAEAAKESE